jgi:hypothetical protein
MAQTMTFAAQTKGRAINCLGGDIYVSCNCGGTEKESLCIRFSTETMDRLRWRIGDRVIPRLDKVGELEIWTIVRSTEDGGNSLKISGQGKQEGHGSVRRRLSPVETAFVFGESRSGYQCRLLRGDSTQAVFEKVAAGDQD